MQVVVYCHPLTSLAFAEFHTSMTLLMATYQATHSGEIWWDRAIFMYLTFADCNLHQNAILFLAWGPKKVIFPFKFLAGMLCCH